MFCKFTHMIFLHSFASRLLWFSFFLLSTCSSRSNQKQKQAPQTLPQKTPLQQQACTQSDPQACTDLGLRYQKGEGVQIDQKKARSLFEKACEGGEMQGCNNLGVLYRDGIGVEQDRRKARSLFEKACRGKEMQGCFSLGSFHENLFLTGEGEKELQKALVLFEKACRGKEMQGCFSLGLLYEEGIGLKPDPKKAQSMYELACAGGVLQACARAKTLNP